MESVAAAKAAYKKKSKSGPTFKPDGREVVEEKRLNPKWVERRMQEMLPDVEEGERFLYCTVRALYLYSDDYFFTEDQLASPGAVKFTGSASYLQLACAADRCDRETMKWRIKQLKERWGIIEWKPTQHGIKYVVRYQEGEFVEVGNPDYPVNPDYLPEAESSSEVGNEKIEVGNGDSEVGNETVEVGNPDYLLCLSGIKSTGILASPIKHSASQEQGDPATPQTKSKTQNQVKDQINPVQPALKPAPKPVPASQNGHKKPTPISEVAAIIAAQRQSRVLAGMDMEDL